MEIPELFKARLPRRPYCFDERGTRALIRPAATALERMYIQPNAPLETSWLIFDLDYADSAFAWDGANLPQPTLVVSNPQNAHSHLFYGLNTPVCTSEAARIRPLRYAAAVESAFRETLRADPGYAGFIAKNPFHGGWRSEWGSRLYDLSELAEYVDLSRLPPRKRSEAAGLGRNCTLFEEIRAWAYRSVLDYKRAGANFDLWNGAVLDHAEQLNSFLQPLNFSEVKAVAKSVARWVWRNFSPTTFSALQSARGKCGGRPRTTTQFGEPWVDQGISRATYYRRIKSGLLVLGGCGNG